MPITVTRSGSDPTTTVRYAISTWGAVPYLYGQFAASIGLNWTVPSGATMQVNLIGRDTSSLAFASTPGTYAKPAGSATKYAGDWAIDNSDGFYTSHDTGVDVLTGGISAATMADPARSIADELPPTCTYEYLEFVITWNASSGGATIDYPVFYAPTTAPKLIWLSGQCLAMIYENGPGVRFGNQRFYDPITHFQTTPEVLGLGFKSSVIDWIAWREAVLNGVAPSSSAIDSELSGTWFDAMEYSAIGDASQVTMGVPLPMTSDGAIRTAIVSGYREVPPMALCPTGARDPVTWLPTGADEQASYDLAQEARYLVQAGSSAQLYPPTGGPWTTPLPSFGQWKLSSHTHAVTDAEDDTFLVKDPRGTYGDVTPWHGWFLAGLPGSGDSPTNLETGFGEHHMCYLDSGDLRYRWSPFTGAQWAFDTPITAGTAFAGGWSHQRMAMDYRSRVELRAYHANQGGDDPLAGGVYRLWSDDDGRTWGPLSDGALLPEVVLLAATQTEIRCSPDGVLLEMVFVPDSGTSGPGTFSARVKGPGDASFSDAFTPQDDASSDLRSDGSGFGFDKGREGPDRWFLVMVKDGDDDPSVWWSADEGKTWKETS